MVNSLILAASTVATEEHHERVLYGLPTFWYGIIFAIAFLLMFVFTVSFSGRGIVRSHSDADQLDADERAALQAYNGKHTRH